MITNKIKYSELLNEISKESTEKSRLIGNCIAQFEYIVKWLENPKKRILDLDYVLKSTKELIKKLI